MWASLSPRPTVTHTRAHRRPSWGLRVLRTSSLLLIVEPSRMVDGRVELIRLNRAFRSNSQKARISRRPVFQGWGLARGTAEGTHSVEPAGLRHAFRARCFADGATPPAVARRASQGTHLPPERPARRAFSDCSARRHQRGPPLPRIGWSTADHHPPRGLSRRAPPRPRDGHSGSREATTTAEQAPARLVGSRTVAAPRLSRRAAVRLLEVDFWASTSEHKIHRAGTEVLLPACQLSSRSTHRPGS